MARPANPNSKRQRGIQFLDDNPDTKREFVIPKLMEKLSVGRSYAETIHATWRTQNKKSGELIAIFTVKDLKDGKPVLPYVKKEFVSTVNNTQAKTLKRAKSQYFARQKQNAVFVNNL